MKYIIPQSRLEKLVFKYLDSQNLIKIKTDINIYFAYNEDDDVGVILYDTSDGWCFVLKDFLNTVINIFTLSEEDAENIVGKWVQNTLGMSVSNTEDWAGETPFNIVRNKSTKIINR